MSERMKKRILEAQVAEDTDKAKMLNNVITPQRLTLEACQCKHLLKYLPHVLDLSCAILPKNDQDKLEEDDEHKETHWIMCNPVHALHMTSQLEPDGATVYLPKEQAHGEPALYGEEQVRTKTLVANGVSTVAIQEENAKQAYITTHFIPTHQASSSSSAATDIAKQKQISATNVPSGVSNTTGAVGAGQPPTRNATMMAAPRRPSMPSGIVPPGATTAFPQYSSYPHHQQQPGMPRPTPGTLVPNPNMNYRYQQQPFPPGARAGVPLPQAMSFQPPPPGYSSATARMKNPPPKAASHPPSSRLPPSNNKKSTPYLLSDERFQELQYRQHALLNSAKIAYVPRRKPPVTTTASSSTTTSSLSLHHKSKRKRMDDPASVALLPSSTCLFGKTLHHVKNIDKWQEDARVARATVEEWMERFRISRIAYWQQQHGGEFRECLQCSGMKRSCGATGDALMQCLECPFVGCGPQSLMETSKQHMMHHMLRTGHTFAVTCGERAEVFCFKCGDFCYHDVFDQERERIDISFRLPWMSWHEYPVQRSFDAMQFINTAEHGIIWRGLIASYPPLVPTELVRAARLSMRRLLVNRGEFASPSSLSWGSKALGFAVYENQQAPKSAVQIQAPVGMYNLGNTCFMTCILQCLIHCVPLQQHFLRNVGHHYKSCEIIRSAFVQNDASSTGQSTSSKNTNDEFKKSNICLACEMDKLFLQYLGSSIGRDVTRAVCQSLHPLDRYENSVSAVGSTGETSSKSKSGGTDFAGTATLQGDPLVTTKLLAAAWKSGGMDHLAGYEQGDAHEFLQAFLDTVGKHAGEYHKLLRFMQKMPLPSNKTGDATTVKGENADIIKQLFEGTLRSVLICEECGCKRKMPEPFLDVSLPLSKHIEERNASGARGVKPNISLERCLEQFTSPETLADPVHCPSCLKKTPTKKQHTFSKLPKVLCLHLKRFDAAKNRKIDDFVSFPAHGLDLGKLLPHWRETGIGESSSQGNDASSPRVLYDLFATANHTGTLHQGHYVANVKVGDEWFHCNDAHVSRYDENGVLHSEGAYVLFYIRRQLDDSNKASDNGASLNLVL